MKIILSPGFNRGILSKPELWVLGGRVEDAAHALGADLGQLALALAHAGTFIRNESLASRAYEELLHSDQRERVDVTGSDVTQHPRTIALTLQTSTDRLTLGHDLLARLAWHEPDAIPKALLPPGLERTDRRKALAELCQYSLVTRDDDALTPHFSIHRLVQAAARHSLPPQNAEVRLGETVKWLAEAMKPVGSKFAGKPAELIPHVLSVLHFLQTDEYRDSETGELLDPLARLVIFALLLTKADTSPSRQGTRHVVPEYLVTVLGGFYEVEPLSAAVSHLIQDDYASWPKYRDKLLSSDNYVLRYAMSMSLAKTCRETSIAEDLRAKMLSDVVALSDDHSDLNKFELGGYAVNQIYAAEPKLIGRAQMKILANRLAEHEAYLLRDAS